MRSKDLDPSFTGSILDTFKAQYLDITVPANTEIFIKNPFRQNGRVPKYWVEVNRQSAGILTKGNTPWTADALSFYNRDAAITVNSGLLLFLE